MSYEIADIEAKNSINEKSNIIEILKIDQEMNDVFLHVSTETKQLIELYPVKFLRKEHQDRITQCIAKKLESVWSESRNIQINKILRLTKDAAGKENWLDASTQTKNEIAFRTKMLFKQLPCLTNVAIYKPQLLTACPRCLAEPETQNHIWICPKTIEAQGELIGKTIEIIKFRKENLSMYKILKEAKKQPQAKYFLPFLGLNLSDSARYEQFLGSNWSKEIIDQDLLNRFNLAKAVKKDRFLWMHLVMDSWLSAFYDIIWKNRSGKVRERSELTIGIILKLPPPPRIRLHLRVRDPEEEDSLKRIKRIKFILPSPPDLSPENIGVGAPLNLNNQQNGDSVDLDNDRPCSSSEVTPNDLPPSGRGTQGLCLSKKRLGDNPEPVAKRMRSSATGQGTRTDIGEYN